MNLSSDVSRCVGRFGLGENDPVCPRRSECARYVAMADDREKYPEGYPESISVSTGLCRDGGDFFIPQACK